MTNSRYPGSWPRNIPAPTDLETDDFNAKLQAALKLEDTSEARGLLANNLHTPIDPYARLLLAERLFELDPPPVTPKPRGRPKGKIHTKREALDLGRRFELAMRALPPKARSKQQHQIAKELGCSLRLLQGYRADYNKGIEGIAHLFTNATTEEHRFNVLCNFSCGIDNITDPKDWNLYDCYDPEELVPLRKRNRK